MFYGELPYFTVIFLYVPQKGSCKARNHSESKEYPIKRRNGINLEDLEVIWDFSGFYFIFFCVFMGFLRVFAGSWPDTATNCADPGIDLFPLYSMHS